MPSATTILALALPHNTALPPTDLGVVNITPTVTLAGGLQYAIAALNGNIAPPVTIAGALTVTSPNSVDLGFVNIAPVVSFSAAFSPIPAPPGWTANLSPVVSLSGKLTAQTSLFGFLYTNVALAGVLNSISVTSGGIAPTVTFNGYLSSAVPFTGNLTTTVTFGPSVLQGGPLWVPTPPCDPVDWEDAELCHG